MPASYSFPTMIPAASVGVGDKVFPERDGQALPQGIVAAINRTPGGVSFELEDGRNYTPEGGTVFTASRCR